MHSYWEVSLMNKMICDLASFSVLETGNVYVFSFNLKKKLAMLQIWLVIFYNLNVYYELYFWLSRETEV